MNIDFKDPNLKNFVIPSDFLNKTHIGRCSFDFKGGCSNPGGLLADFNIWDRLLSREEAEDWTSCRFFLSFSFYSTGYTFKILFIAQVPCHRRFTLLFIILGTPSDFLS